MKEFLSSFGGLVALMIGIVIFPPLAAIIVVGGMIMLAWMFFGDGAEQYKRKREQNTAKQKDSPTPPTSYDI
ncbi:MAG: hypothetical protein GX599_02170 [Chloroflexi bacterium]|nr:hypothetical protein [Chloroflexota bacterium]